MTKTNNVKLPSHIEIDYIDEDMMIISRWFTWPRLVFALVGIGIYLSLAVRISSTAESDIISLVVLLTGGFFIFMGMVCFFIGRTFLILNKIRLHVSHSLYRLETRSSTPTKSNASMQKKK